MDYVEQSDTGLFLPADVAQRRIESRLARIERMVERIERAVAPVYNRSTTNIAIGLPEHREWRKFMCGDRPEPLKAEPERAGGFAYDYDPRPTPRTPEERRQREESDRQYADDMRAMSRTLSNWMYQGTTAQPEPAE